MVDASFERLKRFNLAEIYEPTQPAHAPQLEGKGQSLAPSSQLDDAFKLESEAAPGAMAVD